MNDQLAGEEVPRTPIEANEAAEEELPRNYNTSRGKYRRAYEADAQLPMTF